MGNKEERLGTTGLDFRESFNLAIAIEIDKKAWFENQPTITTSLQPKPRGMTQYYRITSQPFVIETDAAEWT